ncbi:MULTISPECIES: hypothetical protein [Mycolicibacterium]|uniref:hypothetical protein n=1 Tax=Mycolicibacterium TaxID=1866885 RepID=UPI0021F33EBB|nr:hypothetical protein [Mycolicibacterium fluoranthenivorans]MCV7354602.1 hypothetical protein [Mycolicibacterium fluoranthenivorans]MCX2714354.1 hypothetical protein [Mycolicibacterium sp. J2]
MPALGTEMTILDGTPESRRFVAGFTRPAPDGPILVGAVALDAPRSLLRYHDHIGRLLSPHRPTSGMSHRRGRGRRGASV